MEIINTLALFLLGFFFLIKGAQYLVHGATAIAKLFKLSTWFVGAVIVSFGTSVPELSVNIASAFTTSSVGISTVLGSNLFNILVILGLAGLFTPVVMHRDWVIYDFTFHIFASVITGIFIFINIGAGEPYSITGPEGIILFLLFAGWIISLWKRKVQNEEELDVGAITLVAALLLFFGGLVGVFFGGRWVVDGAQTIATLVGVSEAVIGLTVVALGTSLPEFAVSFIALVRGSSGLAVGNLIGSSVINLLAVLGVTAMIHPIVTTSEVSRDMLAVIAMSILLFVFMFVGKRMSLSRFEGLVFLFFYVGYVVFAFMG